MSYDDKWYLNNAFQSWISITKWLIQTSSAMLALLWIIQPQTLSLLGFLCVFCPKFLFEIFYF